MNEGLMFLNAMAGKGDSIEDMLAKALANYMFREIIEDAHVKYGISQEDMKNMNKKAANRAKLFLEEVSGNIRMEMAFSAQAIMCNGWDKPEITDEEEKLLDHYRETANAIKEIEKKDRKNSNPQVQVYQYVTEV